MTDEAEALVAFHGPARLLRWQADSGSGHRCWFALDDGLAALEPFERATRRRGKTAGQRYSLVVCDADGEIRPDAPSECRFAGANWSQQAGPTLTLWFLPSDLDWWQQNGGEDRTHFLTLVELTDDEQPVDQVRADRLVGGPLSKNCGMTCQEPEFQKFARTVLGCGLSENPKEQLALVEARVRDLLGVESRAQLDHDERAGLLWKSIRSEYIRWGEKRWPSRG